jgi:transposase
VKHFFIMIKVTFIDEEKEQIKYERYHHPHPRVQQKMEVLHLKALGLKLHLICLIANVTPNTVRNYIKQYLRGGLEEVKRVNFYRPQSELDEHKESIEDYFEKHPPSSIAEAVKKIEELTGIKRGLTQVRKFLKSIGFKFRKVGSIPAKMVDELKKTPKGIYRK